MADADDTNEDSWLYGTSNPDSTTNEEERGGIAGSTENRNENELQLVAKAAENEAQAVVDHESCLEVPKPENDDGDKAADDLEEQYGEFEDPAEEMEEDEEAAISATIAADTTEVDEEGKAIEQGQGKSSMGSDDDVDDEDDSDDDINVVIGDIKSAPSSYNIKQRSNLLAGSSGVGQEKTKSAGQGGKFSVEDFDGVGTINGVAAHEFSIDSLEDKPWRKPGADITDYFNYGFNEETWRAYCERQKRMRVVESGVGLASLTQNLNQPPDRHNESTQPGVGAMPGIMPPGTHVPVVTAGISNDQMQLPPPGMITHQLQSHHSGAPRMGPREMIPRGPRPISAVTGSKENAIQVMTAECREYSRPSGQMPAFGGPPPGEEHYFPEPEPYDYGYEPTQESQWGNDNPGWVPTGIKELTPGPSVVQPLPMSGPPGVSQPPMNVPPPQMGGPPSQMRSHPPLIPGPVMAPNMNMGPPPPGMNMMMGPGGGPAVRMPMGPPHMMAPGPHSAMDRREHERDRERDSRRERERREERDRERERREERDRDRERREERDRERDRKERDRERDRDRERSEKIDKQEEVERTDEDRERRRRERERERERERDRERERGRRERSRSREKSRRRSKSREKERERSTKTSSSSSSNRSEKKKSHRKDKDEEE